MDTKEKVPSRADELKRALVAIRNLRRRVDELEQRQREPVAIIGQSCRLPGGADTPQKFWELIRDGADATSDVPIERWDAEAIYDPDPNAIGGAYVKRGGFLQEPVDGFDPGFFSISPREASAMDPMHRMLLELAWEALEDAGIPPFTLDNSATGVFVGLSTSDYGILQQGSGLEILDSYKGTGAIASIATGRISHFLGLQGPNFPVDTACSSGLVALALAVEQLRTGSCDLALAGAANLMLAAESTVSLCRIRALAPDGRCRTFDASAGGYSRGEGAGIFALKRLDDARRDGNRIYAVVRGVACNHDGHSSGLTVPNPAAQRKVIKAALRDAGIDPLDISYVEAHGTATELGDPIELRALSDVLCQGRTDERPLNLGSVKTNIGHLEVAAGISGVLKVVQSMQHRKLPPHLHLENPTPHIDWKSLPVRVPTELTDWSCNSGPLIAGVSAFGFSGTNAHVIIEEAPPAEVEDELPSRPAQLIAISARDKNAVGELAGRYREQLTSGEEALADDLACTSTVGRSHHSYRAVATGSGPEELATALQAIQQTNPGQLSRSRAPEDVQIAFLFTGQGAQSPAMAKELYDSSPIFREKLEECNEILRGSMDKELLPLLLDESEASNLDQTQYTQPALFAFEYALYELWRSWGVEPAYVLGHSLGEYVAATVAGIFDLQESLPLVALRGRLMQELSTPGQMAAVLAAENVVAQAIEGVSGVSVAAFNSPENIVVSGAAEMVAEVSRTFAANDVSVSDLQVSHAFHSPLMDPMLEEFEDAVRKLTLHAPRFPLISNLTGKPITDAEATDPARWRRHIREPVRFSSGMMTLAEAGVNCFVEIGPHPTLSGLGMESVGSSDVQWLPSCRRNQSAWQQLSDSVGKLYCAGYDIDWNSWQDGYRGKVVTAPFYPFQRHPYWFTDLSEGVEPAGQSLASGVAAQHPLLGVELQSPAISGHVYELVLRPDRPAYLKEHQVFGKVVVPGAMFVEMMLAAAREGLGWDRAALRDLAFEQPLVIDAAVDRAVQIIASGPDEGHASVRVVSANPSADGEPWITHSRATLTQLDDESSGAGVSIEEQGDLAETPVDVSDVYSSLAKSGIEYGAGFQALLECRSGGDFAVGRARLIERDASVAAQYALHPCLLDAGFQLLAGVVSNEHDDTATRLPAGVDEIRLHRPIPDACRIYALARESAEDDLFVADISFFDESGHLCAEVIGFNARKVDGSLLRKAIGGDSEQSPTYSIDWQATAAPDSAVADPESDTWLLFVNDGATSNQLVQYFEDRGVRTIRVRLDDDWAQFGDVYTLPRNSDESWDRLVQATGIADGSTRLGGVVHLWGVNPDVRENTDGDEIVSRMEDSLAPLARLLEDGVIEHGAPIRIVSSGASGPHGAGPGSWATGAALRATLPVLQAEHPEFNYRAVDLDPGIVADQDVIVQALFGDSDEDRLALRDGEYFAPRIARVQAEDTEPDHRPVPHAENYRINIRERGTIDALHYVPVERREPQADEIEIRVLATGLNFRDVLNVLGMYPGDPGPPGVEVTGVVTRAGADVRHVQPGDHVFGLGNNAFAGYITTAAAGVVRIPEGMSVEEAATIPLAFLTAEWGLHNIAQLAEGERVLIHAAAGGVGQAAVQLALAKGAEVHATAGSDDKRKLLRRQGVVHVYSSREPSFADEVLQATGGEGVDVVLNALTGDMLQRSLDLLRPGGRFIELGKAELLDADELAAGEKPVMYASFDLGSVLVDTPDRFQELFNSVVGRFVAGELHPLRLLTYRADEVVDAFRYMAQARHIGKIVVAAQSYQLREPEPVIRGDAAYVVTGASGALGKLLAEWLIEQGAGAVVLNARREPDDEIAMWLDPLQHTDTTINWVAGDVASADCVRTLVSTATAGDLALGGIFHAAGVLDDGMFRDLDRERIRRVLVPKVQGAWNLHTATRNSDLDHFVLFSSVAATMGGPGQANYAAANAFLSALAERRQRSGLPGISAEWGAWDGAGMAARLSARERQALANQGMGFLKPDAAFDALEELLREPSPPRPVVADFDWRLIRPHAATMPPLFRDILDTPAEAGAAAAASAVVFDASDLAELDDESRYERVTDYIRSVLQAVLGARPEQLELDLRLGDLGFDSLMAMEMRNRIEKEAGVVLPVGKLLGSTTVGDFASVVNNLLDVTQAPKSEEAQSEVWDEGEI
jgi:malonyl CoA-acyl carrier protein transacylase